MFLFAIYAVLVWYAAARWRRRWQSFAWVAAGLLGLVVVAWLHLELNRWSGGRLRVQVFQSLLYPFTLFVGAIGLYIACLPRAVRSALHCRACEYELSGLDEPVEMCPECGTPHVAGSPLTRVRRARSAPPAEPLPAGPRSPAIAGPAVCRSPRAE